MSLVGYLKNKGEQPTIQTPYSAGGGSSGGNTSYNDYYDLVPRYTTRGEEKRRGGIGDYLEGQGVKPEIDLYQLAQEQARKQREEEELQKKQDQAKKSAVAYNENGRVNVWQTVLNLVKNAQDYTKASRSEEELAEAEKKRKSYLEPQTAEEAKEVYGLNYDLKQSKFLSWLLGHPVYTPAKGVSVAEIQGAEKGASASEVAAKIKENLTGQVQTVKQNVEHTKEALAGEYSTDFSRQWGEEMRRNADAAKEIAQGYGVPTYALEDSETRRNADEYLSRYQGLNFGEGFEKNVPLTMRKYGLDVANAALLGVNAISEGAGKLGMDKVSSGLKSIYRVANFFQDAGSGLTEQALGTIKENTNWLGKLVYDIEGTTIEQLMDRTIGAVTGTSGLLPMGVRVIGSGAQEAEERGESVGKQLLTAGARGGVEIATELMGGVGGSWRGTGYGDAILGKIDKWVTSKTGSELLGTLANAFSGEAVEEMVADVLNPLMDRILGIGEVTGRGEDQSFMQKLANFFIDVWGDGQLLYDGLLGGLSGMGGGAVTQVGYSAAAKSLAVDVATYKAAERIAGDSALKAKFEELTGQKLAADDQTALVQAAIYLTNVTEATGASPMQAENELTQGKADTRSAALATEFTNVRQFENDVQDVFSDRDIDLSAAEAKTIADAYIPQQSGTTAFLYGMREAYQYGQKGIPLAQAMEAMQDSNSYGRELASTQVRIAWTMGAGYQTAESGTVDTKTQEGRDQALAELSALGKHAEKALAAYDGKGDIAEFAGAMNKAAALYAASGADLQTIARDARSGEHPDIVGKLTDAQLEVAAEIGAQIRAERQTKVKESAEKMQSIKAQAAEIEAGGAELKEVNAALNEAREYEKSEQAEADRLQKEADELINADEVPDNAEEIWNRATEAAREHRKNAEGTRQTIEALESKRQELQNREPGKRKKGTVSFDGAKIDGHEYKAVDQGRLNRAQKKLVAMVQRLADLVNIDYIFFDGPANMGGAYVRGGTVYVNINSGLNPTTGKIIAGATLSHELTHFMQEFAPAEYAELKDFVVSAVLKKSAAEFDRLIKQQQRWEPGKSYDELVDEMVANACQTMLLHDKFIKQMARQNMTLAEKVADVLEDLSAKIREAFDGLDATKDERAVFDAVRAVVDEIDGMAERWSKGIAAAVEGYNAVQTVRGQTENRQKTGSNQTEKSAPAEAKKQVFLDEYSEREKENWKGSKRLTVYENDAQLLAFVKRAQSEPDFKQRMVFGKIGQQLAEKIKAATGYDLAGRNVALRADNIRKLQKSHGGERAEKTRGQKAITPEDYTYLAEIVSDADTMEASEYQGRPAVVFSKQYGKLRRTAIMVDSGKGSLDLFLQTMYINEKRSIAHMPDAESSRQTSETTVGTASENSIAEGTEESKSQKQFIGESSETADRQALDTAKRLIDEGESAEAVRQATGWFRGMDGKWRYEIDDSGAKWESAGDVQFRRDHPEYDEYRRLLDKMLNTPEALTEDENKRLVELDSMWSGELHRLSQRAKRGGARLGDVLRHDELFKAYPWLKNLRVEYADIGNSSGELIARSNGDSVIRISKNNHSPLSTLIHEIQHAIQHHEGFATGSSKAYWEKRLKAGYAEQRKSAEFKKADQQYNDLFNSAPEELKNKIRALNRAKLSGDLDAWDEIEADLYDGQYSDLFMAIDNADWERRRVLDADMEFDAYELYKNTAGEIEARDVQARQKYSAEQRRKTPPAEADENTVFADGDGASLDVQYQRFEPDEYERYTGALTEDEAYNLLQLKGNDIREVRQAIRKLKPAEGEWIDRVVKGDASAEEYAAWMKESGLDELYSREKQLDKETSMLSERYDELITERLENEERAAIEKSGLPEAEYFGKQAVKTFGYTPYFYDAGYITLNGKMLNFSGEKGKHFGSRGEDHRAIGQIFANTQMTAALTRFMNYGNIRLIAETPGLDIASAIEPTAEQYRTIRSFARNAASEEYFAVDFSDERGNVVGTLEYEGTIRPDRVVNDIKHYYQTGEIRESGLSAFYQMLGDEQDDRWAEMRQEIEYGERALVSEETLDRWLKDYAASNPKYAQAYIVYMDPFDFLRMTTSGIASRQIVKEQAAGLSVDAALDFSKGQPIQLIINSETGKVEGHEGRHRMVALKTGGIRRVPVLLFDSGNKYSKTALDSLTLHGQDFNGKTNSETTTVRDVQPLSTGNREAVAERFTQPSSMERIREKYGTKQYARFQKWDDTTGDTATEANGRELAYNRLQSENKILSDTIKALNKTIGKKDTTIGKLLDRLQLNKTPEVREADARKLAKALLREHSSIADYESVTAKIKALGDYLVQTENVSEEEIKNQARSIAAEILESATEQVVMEDEQLTAARSAIKGKKLTIAPEFLGELDQAGGYDLFRRQNFGKFTLARADSTKIDKAEYMSVSQFYADMHNQYGEYYFPDAANEGEEAIILARVMEAGAPIEINPYRQYMGEATESLANRIARDAIGGVLRLEPNRYADVEYRREKTRNEALNEHIKQLVEEKALAKEEAGKLWTQVQYLSTQLEHAEMQYRALEKSSEERIAQVREEGAARELEIKTRERAKAENKIKALKEFYNRKAKQQKEMRENAAMSTKYRKDIEKKAKKLREMLVTNSDKLHVPEVLKAPLGDFLAAIDFSSKSLLNHDISTQADERNHAAFLKMLEVLQNQQDYINGDGEVQSDLGGYIDVSQDSMDFLRKTASEIYAAMSEGREYTVNRMNTQQLKELSKLLSNLTHAIRDMNHFMANARYESVKEAASADIDNMNGLGRAGARENSSLFNTAFWENGTPYYIMKRFGDGARAVFDGLTRGWEKMAFNVQEVINYAASVYSTKEVNEWKAAKHEITLESGQKITMTTAQIMEFSMLLGREQALKHIEHGGVRIGDIETRGGKLHDTTHYHLSAGDIAAITGLLTDRQAQVAKALQNYMAVKGAEWGNEISMRRFGYKFYTEGEAYYPIKTDANDRPMSDTENKENSMFRLLNLSSSKTLNPRANNALVINDIFDTFSDHMADMAKLNGMGLPILDAIKWFNYKEKIKHDDGTFDTRTLQGAMEQAFGTAAQRYFRTLIKDINGVRESSDRGTAWYNKLMSNYKAAAVAANLRVAFLQPTSYVRASYVLKPKYLAGVLPSMAAYREAMKYSGTANWKDIGGYDTNLAQGMREQIEHNSGWKDQLVKKSMWLAETGDKITWSRLWTACKRQVHGENASLSGEALNRATADLFREVVYATQVMDSTLTRSEIMRGNSNATKAMTAFMAEPTLSYNLLMDAASEYRLDVRKNGKRGALSRNSGKLGKAFTVYVCSAAFSAVVESVFDAMRDDDDYESFMQKWAQAMFGEGNLWRGNLAQDLTILGKLPFLKNFISTLQGYKSGDMGLTAFNSAIDAVKIWEETIKLSTGALDKATKTTYYGNMTDWGKVYKTLQALSQLTGIGVSNAARDVIALWNTAVGYEKPEWKIKTYDAGQQKSIKDAFLSGALSEEEAAAKLVETGEAKDADKAYWTVRGWSGEDKYTETKTAAFSGDAETFKAEIKQLTEHGGAAKDAYSAVKSLIKKVYMGEELDEGEQAIVGERSLTDAEARRMLHDYAGMSADDAVKLVDDWKTTRAFVQKHGGEYERYGITVPQAQFYYSSVKGSASLETYAQQLERYGTDRVKAFYGTDGWSATGLNIEQYNTYATEAAKCKGTDSDGDGKTDAYSVKNQVLLVIDALPVSSTVKDAIYRKRGWAERDLAKAPWHR